MTSQSLAQSVAVFQVAAWFITLFEVIAGLYVLVLNPRHPANRLAAFSLFFFAGIGYCTGLMIGAADAYEARWGMIGLASSAILIEPVLLLLTILLFKPEWQAITLSNGRQRIRGYWQAVYLFLLIPALMTTFDLANASGWLVRLGIDPKFRLWYTGLSEAYHGGWASLVDFTGGLFARPLFLLSFALFGLVTIGLLFYVAIFDSRTTRRKRFLAWLLLVAQIASGSLQMGLFRQIDPGAVILFSNGIFLVTFAFAIVWQITSDPHSQSGSLQTRLTSIVLVTALPVVVGLALFLSNQARLQLKSDAVQSMGNTNQMLSNAVTVWLESNVRALQELVSRQEIIRMDASQQPIILTRFASNYPQMFLVSTVDLKGVNVARSDTQVPKDYSDQIWFQKAREGNPVTYQIVKELSSGQPALVVSVPIYTQGKQIVGVGMFAIDLDVVTSRVKATRVGRRGFAYVVDGFGNVLAHPDPGYSAEITSLADYPPVMQLFSGQRGDLSPFSEPAGTRYPAGLRWRAYGNTLANGWGVVVQIPENDLFAPIQVFQRISLYGILLGATIILALAWLAIRQNLLPVRGLASTAQAISRGDFTQVAETQVQDEFGLLAQTFNTMTARMRELISGLESRVGERTQELERRAVQLQVTADVAREAASIRDLEKLLENTASLISARFGYYHTGIFLLDEAKEFAILRAASSEGGRRMLARSHKLKIGQTGIVGYVAALRKARIALDVGQDAVYFNNPDLPLTRSEAGLPLLSRDQVIGVLDVQSVDPGAFKAEELATLQILADQIALAIDNARLLNESQAAYKELEALFGAQLRRSWEARLQDRPVAYAYDPTGRVRPANSEQVAAWKNMSAVGLPAQASIPAQAELPAQVTPTLTEGTILKVPITLRGIRLGTLSLRRSLESGPWQAEDQVLVKEIVTQAALSLENARLLEEVAQRASQEQMVSQMAAKAQSSLDLETVMKVAVQEIGKAFDVARVQIRIHPNGGSAQPPDV